jgi:hypothetical protein
VPTWTAIAVSAGTPLLTFVGVLVAQYLLRKGANELEVRSRREETLRVLRWAAELAISADEGKARLGIAQLNALGDSELLDEAQQLFVDAALDAAIDEQAGEVKDAGEDAAAILSPDSIGAALLSGQNDEEADDDD